MTLVIFIIYLIKSILSILYLNTKSNGESIEKEFEVFTSFSVVSVISFIGMLFKYQNVYTLGCIKGVFYEQEGFFNSFKHSQASIIEGILLLIHPSSLFESFKLTFFNI